jgi:hypothetical protein
MRPSSLGSSAIGVAEEAEVIALPTALARATSNAAVAQRCAVAYVRESTEEQGKGFSPNGQRQAIKTYADEHGFEQFDEYMDLESGRGRREARRLPALHRRRGRAQVRRGADLPHVAVRAEHDRGQALQEAAALRAGDRGHLGHPAARRRQRPAAFPAESVHEIFDEYYSVSLSFWTTMGLKEKARQGFLTGGLAWG